MAEASSLLRRRYSKGPEDLLPLVYEELRRLAAAKLARESPGQTLQATALVHEAWLRLSQSPGQNWQDRAHFFRTAAECIRRILIDNARRKATVRHGGSLERIPIEDVDLVQAPQDDQALLISDALDRLDALDPAKAEIVKLRFFAGLDNREIAEVLGVSERTVERAWCFAKAWLLADLSKTK